MKTIKGRISLSVIVALVLILSGMLMQANAEVKTIGFFSPMTGFAAEDGISARNGANLAIEFLKKKGIKDLKLVAYDDQADYKQATSVVRKMIFQDKVTGIVSGSYSGPTKVAAPISQKAKIPLISAYAVHPEITKAGDFIFRMIYTGDVKGNGLGYYAIKNLKYKKFAMLYWDKEWGTSIAGGVEDFVKNNGGQMVYSKSFAISEKDFSPYITSIKNEGQIDLVFVISIYGPGTLILRQARDMGLNAPILAPDGLDAAVFPKLAGKYSENVMVLSNFSRDDKRTIVQDFIEAYQSKFNKEPDMVSSSSFDAVMLMGMAVNKGKTAEGTRDYIRTVNNFEAVSGKVSFNEKREVAADMIINTIRNGQYVYTDRIKNSQLPNK
jgi:branched-chain amino acid transport system substrate-binding protein